MRTIFLLLAATLGIKLMVGAPEPNKIAFTAPSLYPEGIAFDTKNNIAYVGSVKTGTIGTVDAAGKYTEVLVDKELKSSFGMKVDERAKKLWVCVGDPMYSIYQDSSTFKKMARVIAIDLVSKKKVADIDLSTVFKGKHFLNDLTLDGKGNIYVTDSFSPVIYKIDSKGTASVFAQDDRFKSASVGLNGIAYHPDGFLIVAHNTDGVLYRVDIKDPEKIQRITVDQFFPGADGLWMDDARNLILVQNKGVSKIFKLSSSDKWQTATIAAKTPTAELFQNPTTCGMYKGKIYVLNAKLNEIKDKSIKPSDSFSFQEAIWE
jgi:sugar lactone lactonase YvrE